MTTTNSKKTQAKYQFTDSHKKKNKFHIVLDRPEIPQNTGNIGRICVGWQTQLALIAPMSFSIDDKRVKRAGLDYWPHLDWVLYENWQNWWSKIKNKNRVFFFSTKAQNSYFDNQYQLGDSFVFGRETKGLDPHILKNFKGQCLKIPFVQKIRSYNLANSVAMVLAEASRQQISTTKTCLGDF